MIEELQKEIDALNDRLGQMEQEFGAAQAELNVQALEQNDQGLWQDSFNPEDHMTLGDGTYLQQGTGLPVLTRFPKPFHFQVTTDPDTNTAVRVAAGRHTRTSDSTQKTVLLSVDSGTSGDETLYKTVTGFSGSSTTYYVTLTLDNSVTPTTLTAGKATTTYPTGDTDATVKVIAKVVTNSDSIIDTIQQYYEGGDIDDWGHADTSSVAAVTNSGQTVMQTQTYDTYGHVQTNGSYDIKTDFYTESEVDALIAGVTFISLSDTPPNYTSSAGYVLRVNVGETAVEFVDGDGIWWPQAGDYTTCFGSSIGSDAATIKVDLANSQLEGAWATVGTHTATQFSIDADNFANATNVKWSPDTGLNLGWGGSLTIQAEEWEVKTVRVIDDASGSEITIKVLGRTV